MPIHNARIYKPANGGRPKIALTKVDTMDYHAELLKIAEAASAEAKALRTEVEQESRTYNADYKEWTQRIDAKIERFCDLERLVDDVLRAMRRVSE